MALFSKQNFAVLFLGLAAVGLVGAMGYHWYSDQKNYYISGSPPTDILEKVDPKKVPYEQIKAPAFLPADDLVFGSMSSTIGVTFFGDYADHRSNVLAQTLEKELMKYGGRVRMTWHDLPASTKDGDLSFEATVLSECSRLVDKTWPAHDLLMQIPSLAKKDIEILTTQLMDKDSLLYACRQDQSLRKLIRQKIDISRGDGIDKAPFVFVGTHVFPSQTASSTAILKTVAQYIHE